MCSSDLHRLCARGQRCARGANRAQSREVIHPEPQQPDCARLNRRTARDRAVQRMMRSVFRVHGRKGARENSPAARINHRKPHRAFEEILDLGKAAAALAAEF